MKTKIHFTAVLLLIVAFATTQAQQQDSSTVSAAFLIGGEVEQSLTFTMDDLKQMPQQSVTFKDHDGNEATYEGVPVLELLRRAGTALGKNLRGKALTNYMIAEASDGY